jgi:hypothetical protein
LTGSLVVVLTAAAARRPVARAGRLVAAAAVHINGSAAEPLPLPLPLTLPPETTDATGRASNPCTDRAGAGVDRGTAALLTVDAAGLAVAVRPMGPRGLPRATDAGDDDDSAERALDPAGPSDPVASASAAGAAANSTPAPNATARAPTRPTYRAYPGEPGLPADSLATTRCAFTDHQFFRRGLDQVPAVRLPATASA